jgi:hypothetical protein
VRVAVGDAQAARRSAVRMAPRIRNGMLELNLVKCLFNDTTLKSFHNPMIFIVLAVLTFSIFGPSQRSLLVVLM